MIALASLLSFLGMANARDFAEGQLWSYKNRPGEDGSRVLINKVETDPQLGRVFHISVSKVRVKNPRAAGGVTSELPHFPVSKSTLEQSVVKLMGTSKPNPAYLEGYTEWKRAVDSGTGGVFTIPVAEIISAVERVVNQP